VSSTKLSLPKTPHSRRQVDLDDVTVEALQEWREVQRADRRAWGGAWQDHGLVFTREDGSPVYPDGWSGTLERHIRNARLPKIRLHGLRHTHATLLLAAGTNPKIVSERLGRHSVAFTLDTYAL
jgi:integrase